MPRPCACGHIANLDAVIGETDFWGHDYQTCPIRETRTRPHERGCPDCGICREDRRCRCCLEAEVETLRNKNLHLKAENVSLATQVQDVRDGLHKPWKYDCACCERIWNIVNDKNQ